jgi:cytochrome c oxidase cbb3-type subunit 1
MNWAVVILLSLSGVLGLFLSANAIDRPFELHSLLFAGACVVAIFAVVKWHFDRRGRAETGYNDGVVRAGIVASMVWALAGLLVGVYIAAELAFPALNLGLPWINFGRLRPLHTSAVIFAFGGNVLICTSFHVVQRTCRARLAGEYAPWFVFWGYQLFIVLAGTGYLMGVTQGREYAEPE